MIRRLSCVIILAITTLSLGCYTFTKSETYYGIETKGKKIIFLVDVSGSMEGRNEGNFTDKLRAEAVGSAGDKLGSMVGGRAGSFLSQSVKKQATKLGSAKRELEPAIRGLDENNQFTVAIFSNDVKTWKSNLVKATSSSKLSAIAYVKRLSASGGTSALKGLKKAFSFKNVDMIFFLSDGYPSDGSSSKILEEVKEMNKDRKIIIHSIGLGDDKDEKFMEALADGNGGKYLEK